MSRRDSEELDELFAALASPARRAILEQCGSECQTVAGLAEPHAMSLNAISKHIKVLESAGLVSREIDGNVHRIAAEPAALSPAMNWLEYHSVLWKRSLAALKQKLEQTH